MRYLPIFLLFAGCVISTDTWVKEGSSSQDLDTDQRQCQGQALATPGGGSAQISMAFNQCMRAKGWHQ